MYALKNSHRNRHVLLALMAFTFDIMFLVLVWITLVSGRVVLFKFVWDNTNRRIFKTA